ncbi:hypothetical protein ACFSKR_31440 [Kitasatospora cinereorecta]
MTVPARPGLTGWSLADEDAQLVAALDALHGHLAAAATETVALALLEAVFALHGKRADLAQLSAADAPSIPARRLCGGPGEGV